MFLPQSFEGLCEDCWFEIGKCYIFIVKKRNINHSQATASAITTLSNLVTWLSWCNYISETRSRDHKSEKWLSIWQFIQESQITRPKPTTSLGHCKSTFLYKSLGDVIRTLEIPGDERFSEIGAFKKKKEKVLRQLYFFFLYFFPLGECNRWERLVTPSKSSRWSPRPQSFLQPGSTDQQASQNWECHP